MYTGMLRSSSSSRMACDMESNKAGKIGPDTIVQLSVDELKML